MKRKLIATLVVMMLWSVLLAPSALAYIDASGTSLLLNAIIGVFIAGGAAVAVYWHKIKRWVRKKRKAHLKARKAAEMTAMQQNEPAAQPQVTGDETRAL